MLVTRIFCFWAFDFSEKYPPLGKAPRPVSAAPVLEADVVPSACDVFTSAAPVLEADVVPSACDLSTSAAPVLEAVVVPSACDLSTSAAPVL